MKRVLMVTSSFNPAMAADMHRARLLCRELPRHGWDVEVLAPDASYQRPDAIDPHAALFFPAELETHAVGAWRPNLFRMLRIGNIGWRSLWPMYRAGARLLSSGRFDLVYFSTTSFVLFCLGRAWRGRFGVPYVLDFHDPWHKTAHKYITTEHTWKRRADLLLARHMEKWAVRAASGIVSVSPRYLDDLSARYSGTGCAWLSDERRRTIPFAASSEDYLAAERLGRGKDAEETGDLLRIVYVGAGGAIMLESFAAMCRGLALLKRSAPSLVGRARIYLYGTTSFGRNGNPCLLQQVAMREGVGEVVREYPKRVSYSTSLQLVREAKGVLVLGVDDAGYVPSKLFSYALSGKPLLALLHTSSPALRHFEKHPGMGQVIRFGPNGATSRRESAATLRDFLSQVARGGVASRHTMLQPHLAPAMAKSHAGLFDACAVDRRRARSGVNP